uniref:Tudor domain-containing protein n=1 Tax=Culex tarsalis TaxID=7177 RepID=A0A1Q3EZM8_CULTA
MANQEQDNLIRITHYINPHNFWFKQESAYLFNGEDQNFQEELNRFCDQTYGRGNIGSGIYTPGKVDETVAVYYFQLARWIRAQVDAIFPDLSGQVQCNLFAIDEGVPVKSSCRYIKPLPERFGVGCVPTTVKRGGLVGVLPAECSYDYLQGCNVTKMVRDWSPGVVRVFEGCIEEAVTISFDFQHYEVTGIDMYFGTMKITSHQNVTNNATDLLKKAGGKMVMLVDQQEFYDRLPTLRTLDMRRFEDNERVENMKFHTNTFRPEYSTRSKPRHAARVCSYENQAIEQAREKVLDWDERNKRNASVVDFAPLTPKVIAPSSVAEKRNRPTIRVYSQLVNESISDDEEPPQVDIKLPAFQPKQPPQEKPTVPSSPYQRPDTRVYDVDVANVQIALDAIKLRRQASANLARNESASTSHKQAAGGTTCPLNIIPAGYSMGNVHFEGSTIGTSEVGTNKRNATANLFNRNGKPPRKDNAGNQSRPRKPRYEYRADQLGSSSEEEVVRKLTIAPFNADEDNEQW